MLAGSTTRDSGRENSLVELSHVGGHCSTRRTPAEFVDSRDAAGFILGNACNPDQNYPLYRESRRLDDQPRSDGTPGAGQYELSHLRSLEAEAIHIIREVAAEFERPVLLFSGGKDSIVMLHLALKAFQPGRLPFPVMHVDTGHNFDEVITTRDEMVAETGVRLVVAKVQDDIDAGRVVETIPSRNPIQTVTLLRAIRENKFDAAFGGARRDEEKARAKERVFSFRDEFGQWDPKAQRPELWNIYNGRHHKGEHIRVFPLSNWTEFDIWSYIGAEKIKLPSIYYAHRRQGLQARRNAAGRRPPPAATRRRRRCSRRPCGSAPSATSPAPAAWNRTRPPSPKWSPRRRSRG